MTNWEYEEFRDIVINAAMAIRHMAQTTRELAEKMDHRCAQLEEAIRRVKPHGNPETEAEEEGP